MFDPEAALKNAARWLRPGGKILLFEPLEIGGHLMAAVYLSALAELESELHPKIVTFFKGLCHDYEARFGVPRVKPWTRDLDDKWLFHPTYLREMAANIGLTLELVAPTSSELDKMFSNSVRINLNIAGLGDLPTPDKLWELLATFDAGIAPNLKQRFTSEGIIILTKP
jgi:SAM-dependent methyltransferase